VRERVGAGGREDEGIKGEQEDGTGENKRIEKEMGRRASHALVGC
jgi:hypothetical protein